MKIRRSMLSPVWHLAWPAILEMLFSTAVTYADTAMVGRLGAVASASVGLTASVMWLITCSFTAVGVGCVAYISRSIGAGHPEQARSAAHVTLWITLVMGAAIGSLAVGLSPYIPLWMNASEEFAPTASEYFRIINLPMLFRGAGLLFAAVLRGAGDTKTPMRVNVVMNLTNIVLNFFLIYPAHDLGLFVLPGAGIGVRGAAIATAISFVVDGILMLAAVIRRRDLCPFGADVKFDPAALKRILAVGLPVMIQRLISCFGYVAFASLVARLGTVAVAANSIAISAEELFYGAGYGVQSAAATLAGNALGERNEEKFRDVSAACVMISMGLLTLTGITLFIFPLPVMKFFTSDAEVAALGASVLRIVALSEPIYGMMIALEGLFNGIGDTTMPLVVALITMWGVRITFSAVCIIILGLGLKAVWVCMVADNVLRAALLAVNYLRGGWKRRFAV